MVSNPRTAAPFAAALVVLILVYEWLVVWLLGPNRAAGVTVTCLGLGICTAYHFRHSRTWEDWGLAPFAFLPSLAANAGFTLLAVSVFALLGHLWKEPGILRSPSLLSVFYLLLWASAQQWALQSVVLRAMRGGRHPAPAAAAVFAVLHLPNPFLVPATFVAGYVWCRLQLKYPNWLPAAVSHAVCSLTILMTQPRWLTGGMRVGVSWFLD